MQASDPLLSDPLIPIQPYNDEPTCCENFKYCLESIIRKIKEVFQRFINWIKSICTSSKTESKTSSPVTQTPIGGLSTRVLRKKTPSPTGSDHLYDNDVTNESISKDDLEEINKISSNTPTPPIDYFPAIKPPKTPSPDSTRSLEGWELTSLASASNKRKDS